MTDDSTIMEDPTGESVGLIDEVVGSASAISFPDREVHSPVADQQSGTSVLGFYRSPRRCGGHIPCALSPDRNTPRVGTSF